MRRFIDNFKSKQDRRKKYKTNPASASGEPVILNVYDMIPWNKKTMKLGIGIFHAGVEVYGQEYSFHPGNSIGTGVYTAPPREAGTVMKFRVAIPLGFTTLTPEEFQGEMKTLKKEYQGWEYHVLNKNCCTFSSELTESPTKETNRQNSEESGIGSMNEDEPQSSRYSPTSSELPTVDEEEDVPIDKEHAYYHVLNQSNDGSNNLFKTETHKGDNCLTFDSSSKPSDGYSKITNEMEMQPLIPSGQPTSSGGLTSSGQPMSSGGPTSSGQPTSSERPTSSGQPMPSGGPTSSEQPTSSGSSDMGCYVQAANSGSDLTGSDPMHTPPCQDQMVFRATGIIDYYRPENLHAFTTGSRTKQPQLDMRADASCSSGANLSDYVQETSANTWPYSAVAARPTTNADYVQPQDMSAAMVTTDCSSADKVEEYVTVDQDSQSNRDITSGRQDTPVTYFHNVNKGR